MNTLIPFTLSQLNQITQHRSGEIKFGERIQLLPEGENINEYLKNSEANFVLLGIPEDIGVRANLGRAGTHLAWETTLKSLLNMQHNKFFKASQIILLGTINVQAQMQQAEQLNPLVKEDRKKLLLLVEEIDKEVSHIIRQIIQLGKTPIVIGGGHNNAYGNIKGLALAKGKPVNAVNFDAHTDFRVLEGRHSGNGFSYAFEEGFLKNYYIFGLHENYVSKSVFNTIKTLKERIKYSTYEEIAVKQEKDFKQELINALEFLKDTPFGVELDLDSIAFAPSSAMTPSGFDASHARQFVYYFGKTEQASYLHICEGAPNYGDSQNPQLLGKLIAYLITDFIKAKNTLSECPI